MPPKSPEREPHPGGNEMDGDESRDEPEEQRGRVDRQQLEHLAEMRVRHRRLPIGQLSAPRQPEG
jgi:hypothetical protein